MAKLKNISGFPEWLPAQKIVEDRLLETIRRVYGSFGFSPIETRSVEPVSTLAAKGVDKEIYVVQRLHAAESDDAGLALHFDLTVPFARYVAQNFNELVFPFKRYQIQKSWRGERPQKGRFREFYQCDIDIVARDVLPLSADAEAVTVMDQVFRTIAVGRHVIRLNNRKILLGIYSSLGLREEERRQAITAVDKISKIGREGVLKELQDGMGLDLAVAEKIADLAEIKVSASEAEYILSKLEIDDRLFEDGRREMLALLELLPAETGKCVQFDLSLARGLDYYTGVIVEFVFEDHPEFGTVAAGGRYDDLASQFINKKLPGVGMSFGLTRFLDMAFEHGLFPLEEKCPSQILVTVYREEDRAECNRIAQVLRDHGLCAEVFLSSPKLGKQIDYADARGIPQILFFDAQKNKIEVKDLRTKEQAYVPDLEKWASAQAARSSNKRV